MANDIALEYQTAFLYEDDQSGVDRLYDSELESKNELIAMLEDLLSQENSVSKKKKLDKALGKIFSTNMASGLHEQDLPFLCLLMKPLPRN